MRHATIALCVFALLACGTSAFAGRIGSEADPCIGQSLEGYVALGLGGCSVGPAEDALTFFSFGFQSIVINNTNPLTKVATAATIQVTPPAGITDQVEFRSGEFFVGAGDRIVYAINYIIDPPPDILPGFDLDLFAFSPTFPGKATVTAILCAGGDFGDFVPCTPVDGANNFDPVPYFLQVFHNGFPESIQLSSSVEFRKPTNYLSVALLIDLDATLGGSSEITGIGADTVPNPDEIVPEPANIALMGAGLAGLGLLRLRKRKA